jgi:hypothetical protein
MLEVPKLDEGVAQFFAPMRRWRAKGGIGIGLV